MRPAMRNVVHSADIMVKMSALPEFMVLGINIKPTGTRSNEDGIFLFYSSRTNRVERRK